MKSKIYLTKPARKWDDGFPLGNGRLGAMVMGKINEETITINEETLWYGPYRDRKNPDTKKYYKQVRELLIREDVEEAQFLAKMSMTSTPKYMNPYQPAGELRICLMNHKGAVTDYYRCLLLEDAIACVEYELKGIQYKRELLVSQQYQVFAVKISCNQKNKITLSINISRKPFEENTGVLDNCTAANWGQCGVDGVRYFTAARLDSSDGKISAIGDFVYVKNASEVYIYLSSGTDFGENNRYRENGLNWLDKAQKAGYEQIRAAHIKEYQALYSRVTLSLNDCREETLPTDQLLDNLRNGRIESRDWLTQLLFDYARYLMISCSYACQLPANLQGLWNGSFEPP